MLKELFGSAAPQMAQKDLEELDAEETVLPEEHDDLPSFRNTKNAPAELIEETRMLLKELYKQLGGDIASQIQEEDYQRMLCDDWTVTRFLLRRRMDPRRAAKLMEDCGRFRKHYRMSDVQLCDFPIEFHRAAALFAYERDRVGNVVCYLRAKMYRRVPEIAEFLRSYLLCVLEQCDVEAKGRGFVVVFDLSEVGLQSLDLGQLAWLLTSFRNYCPKGVSYVVAYNLPWIMNAACKLVMSWMSPNNKRMLRFCSGKEIERFVAPESLPDFMGGTCKRPYRVVPAGARPAVEVCEQHGVSVEQALKVRELFKQYIDGPDTEAQTVYEDVALNAQPPGAQSQAPKGADNESDSASASSDSLSSSGCDSPQLDERQRYEQAKRAAKKSKRRLFGLWRGSSTTASQPAPAPVHQ